MSKYKRNRHQKGESVAESVYQFFAYGLDLCVCGYMLLLIGVMPFYNEEGFTHIGTDKSTFYRTCAIYGSRIILPVLVVTLIFGAVVYVQKNGMPKWSQLQLKGKLSVTDWFALLYGLAVTVSYLCTNYKEEALWGTKGWFMGLLPQLTAVAIYFFVSRVWKARKWMVAVILPVSAIVFGLGYLNRFGIYPIDMKLETDAFISTIGNINWYCGYVVSVFFGGLFLAWKADWKKNWQKVLIQSYVAIGFATLVTQGSSSGIVTMLVILLVMFWLAAQDGKRMESFWQQMIILSGVCLVTCLLRITKILNTNYADPIVTMLTFSILPVIMTCVSLAFWFWVHNYNKKNQYPATIFKWLKHFSCGGAVGLFVLYVVLLLVNTLGNGVIVKMTSESLQGLLTFSPDWGSQRGATWICGWTCFMEQDLLHKLVGLGPDCLSAFLYNDGSAELVSKTKEYFNSQRLTNAHNEWLTIFINMGVWGFVSYAGMMISAIVRFIKGHNKNIMAAACGICVLAYTVNNMFSFQQSMSLATIFVILGIGENYMKKDLAS